MNSTKKTSQEPEAESLPLCPDPEPKEKIEMLVNNVSF